MSSKFIRLVKQSLSFNTNVDSARNNHSTNNAAENSKRRTNNAAKAHEFYQPHSPIIKELACCEGLLGDFEKLPKELIYYLLSFFRPKHLLYLFCVSRKMNYYASHDNLWMELCYIEYAQNGSVNAKTKITKGKEDHLSWKEIYRKSHSWRWDQFRMGTSISLSNDGKTCSRLIASGSNPAVLACIPLTRYRNQFTVEVKSRGSWIGIGLAEPTLKLSNGSVLGKQLSNGINSSYFCQDTTSLHLNSNSGKDLKLAEKLQDGDCVMVLANFEEDSISYFKNGVKQGVLKSVDKLEEGRLYPCVNLSYKTSVNFVNVL